MREMLHDLAGDLQAKTGGAIEFYVDTLGVPGKVENVRHNCYLRVPKTGYTHLLFRVTTPFPGPWPAVASTPEGEEFPDIQDENQLREAVEKILQRERTKEVVLYLLSTVR
jgi:hypothetical protein